jgi:hypothetical protein
VTLSLNSSIQPSFTVSSLAPALQHPLEVFHGRFVKSWDELPPNGQLKEVAIRVVTIVSAFILYPPLGMLALLGHVLGNICLKERIALKANELSKSVVALRKSGQPGWQQEAVGLVRKSRYDDPWAELERLKGA